MGRRQPWRISFEASGSQPSPAAAESGQHPCARSDYCHGRTVTTVDGEPVIAPALTYRALCERCERYLAQCLEVLPAGYAALGRELRQPSRSGQPARSAFGPRLPLREDIDATMRLTAVILCGWEARVRASPRLGLAPRDPLKPVHTVQAVADAAGTLADHLSVLLALEPGWMTRVIELPPARRPATTMTAEPLHRLATRGSPERRGGDAEMSERQTGELVEQLREFADDDFVQIGVDFVKVGTKLDGAAAALEILRRHHKAQAILGEAGQRPDTLDGVPCRNPDCEDMALELAEPPSDPSLPAMYSRCATCRDEMSREDFVAWSAMYAAWADEHGHTCRRCALGKHRQCIYDRCACAARGHAEAA